MAKRHSSQVLNLSSGAEVDVDYHISGGCEQTLEQPAESPEVEIAKATCTHCGQEVKLTADEDDHLRTLIIENHDDSDDGPDPDDERDRMRDDRGNP